VYGKETYRIEIKDDGTGFDPVAIGEDAQKQESSGLRNLYNRSLAIGAQLSIKSRPGEGTTVSILLPLNF
jgi:signal transduction histidine kinase